MVMECHMAGLHHGRTLAESAFRGRHAGCFLVSSAARGEPSYGAGELPSRPERLEDKMKYELNGKWATSGILAAALAITIPASAEGNKSDPSQQRRTTVEERSDVQPTVGDQAAAMKLSAASVEQIKELQRALAARNLYQDKIDGVVGTKTLAALRNFQTQQGIAPSADINARTADALGLSWEREPVRGTEAPAIASTPQAERQMGAAEQGSVELTALSSDDVQKLQRRLSELGYYQGTADGVMGPQTRGALQRYFQRQAQLVAQGKLGDPAAARLFGINAARAETKPLAR